MSTNAGFIGLGAMGGPMARNLVKKGFPLTVYDVSRAAVERLVAEGAMAAQTPRAVAENSEIVFLSVPGDNEVFEVVLGDSGLLQGARAGLTIVDLSTVSPGCNRRIAAAARDKGARVLGAPVSGGTHGAAAGTLAIMVGGDKEVFERSREVL